MNYLEKLWGGGDKGDKEKKQEDKKQAEDKEVKEEDKAKEETKEEKPEEKDEKQAAKKKLTKLRNSAS